MPQSKSQSEGPGAGLIGIEDIQYFKNGDVLCEQTETTFSLQFPVLRTGLIAMNIGLRMGVMKKSG
jgi:hypothetical protein